MIRSAFTISTLIFLTSLAWMAFEKLIGLHSTHIQYHAVVTNILPIIIVIITAKAIKSYRIKMGGKITFIQAMVYGLTITAFGTLFAPISLWIFENFINPHFYKDFIKYSIDHKLLDKAAAYEYFNHDNYLKESLIGQATLGLILSIILAYRSSRR